MYISRLRINPQRKASKEAAVNPNRLHAGVLATFPPDAGVRPLWRVDYTRHEHALYIVSSGKPDLRHLQESYGWEQRPGECKDYSPLLDSIHENGTYHFRLTANPTHKVPFSDVVDGKNRTKFRRIPHETPKHQVGWLKDKGTLNGFELLGDTLTTPLRISRFRKNDSARTLVTVGSVQFDGVLRATDQVRVRQALTAGIGHAKAYGCGLMTVVPTQ